MIKEKLKQLRDRYVITQAWNARLPNFEGADLCRYRLCFSGRVQKVGFRLEVSELAKRQELTGFCKNLPNGDVYAELQGPRERIFFLVVFMESLVRIKIREKTMEELPLQEETEFLIT